MHLPRLPSSFYYYLFIKNNVLVALQATNGVSSLVSIINKVPAEYTGCTGKAQDVTTIILVSFFSVQPKRDEAGEGR